MTTEAVSPIDGAREGDRAAFESLLQPLLGPAYRIALGILLAPQEAEDAVQEAAFRSWRKIRNVRPGADFKPWFLAIVANECRRTRRLKWWSVVRVASLEPQLGTPDTVESMDLANAFTHLSVAERQVLVLRYYANFSLQETADALHISTQAAKSRVHRALRKLRPYVGLDQATEAY